MIGSQINQYKILEKIGSGGQGTVYKALDTKLNRTAVIKVLPPELTLKPSNFKRFEREAQLCSQLDHPNICTIYDFHSADGVFYIAMQYVAGKNVRQLVAGRPLELRSSVSIAIQVADALAYAHSKNIIHRDIKAGNIMVTDSGQAKILDFGLAKLLEDDHADQRAGQDHAEITELGIPYGTATYAAPEQARGERADHRSDIFSTGVLLYEMLTGIWAFQGKTVIDVRHQVLYGTPKPLAVMRRDPVPPQLQQIIDKALAKEPKDRYQKISQMRDDLRGVLQQIAGAQVMPGDTYAPTHADGSPVKRAWNWIKGRTGSESSVGLTPSINSYTSFAPDISMTSAGSEKKSVAILPFQNLSGDAASSFYEFALADAVITELAQIRSIIVRPSSVIAKYQGKDVNPRDTGKDLRVHAVLSAGFIRSGDKLRVTAQLLDVVTGDILWSDRIDAEGSDILTLQDAIAQRILEGLRLELTDLEAEKLGKHATDNAEAWEEYLRGRDNFGRFIFRTIDAEDCDAAMANFKRAIELDPHFALAYSGLGACYANRVFKGLGEPEDYTYAEAAFSKAFFYDQNVVEARVLMVMIYLARSEKKKARSEIELLEKQFPNDAALYFVKGVLHRLDGKYEQSLKAFEKLARLDPAARAVAAYNRARIFIYDRKFDEALAELDKGVRAEPNHPMLKIFRSGVYYYQGKFDIAIDMVAKVLADNPRMDGIRPLYAEFLAGAGRFDEAREQLTDDALAVSRADHDMAYWVGSTYALLGEYDLAFKWLNKAIRLGNQNKPYFEQDTNLDSLRGDPRFAELMLKMNNGD
ncbi:MAG TPA: protein kinase [Pyrinomonadaceae bacterium]|nr:protein kinase [Chloracidobacterium sp.]MBP9935612.1 protein kinase [Pyrinomonadaceae bacterium]MBL0239834.1 protein kinase [Chloracidobacterium sp.]HQX56372.1 protein kinase [Pyrinomonadaceae bacterium]HQY66500.1 protein kinase [Pyrinomonadaceae bacterium]